MVGSAQHAGLPFLEASAGTQLPALASGLAVQAPDLHALRPHLQMRLGCRSLLVQIIQGPLSGFHLLC